MLRVYIVNDQRKLFHSRIFTSNRNPYICVLESINIKRKFFGLEELENLDDETEEQLINLNTTHIMHEDQDIELRVEVDDEHWQCADNYYN